MSDAELIAEERAKYGYMWEQAEYRVNSPGENAIPLVWAMLGRPRGTFADYGAGEGRVIDWLAARGIECVGYDLVKLHPAVTEACLWKMPARPQTDYGLSFDVLEHIPEQHVLRVLQVIERRSRIACAYTVATIPCTCGRRHGLTLHETVKPIEWWDELAEQTFSRWDRYQADRPWRHLYIGWCES